LQPHPAAPFSYSSAADLAPNQPLLDRWQSYEPANVDPLALQMLQPGMNSLAGAVAVPDVSTAAAIVAFDPDSLFARDDGGDGGGDGDANEENLVGEEFPTDDPVQPTPGLVFPSVAPLSPAASHAAAHATASGLFSNSLQEATSAAFERMHGASTLAREEQKARRAVRREQHQGGVGGGGSGTTSRSGGGSGSGSSASSSSASDLLADSPAQAGFSRRFFKNFTDLRMLQNWADQYSRGQISELAVRQRLFWVTTQLQEQDREQFLESFKALTLASGASSSTASNPGSGASSAQPTPTPQLHTPSTGAAMGMDGAGIVAPTGPAAGLSLPDAALSPAPRPIPASNSLASDPSSRRTLKSSAGSMKVPAVLEPHLPPVEAYPLPIMACSDAPAEDDLDGVARLTYNVVFPQAHGAGGKRKKSASSSVAASSPATSSRQRSKHWAETGSSGSSPVAPHSMIAGDVVSPAASASSSPPLSTSPPAAASSPPPAVPSPPPVASEAAPHARIQINRAWERLTGYTQSEMVERLQPEHATCALLRFLFRSDFASGMHKISLLASLEHLHHGQHYVVVVRKDGGEHYCLASFHCHFTPDGVCDAITHMLQPLPPSTPIPPLVPGVDQTEAALVYGNMTPLHRQIDWKAKLLMRR